MTRSAHRPLATALSLALGLMTLAPYVQAGPQAAGSSMREQRAKRMAQLGKEKATAEPAEQKPAAYPGATRAAPDARASAKMVKALQALQDLYEKQDMAGVMAKADEVAGMSAAGAYEKSFAYSLAGNAAADLDDQTRAADYFAKAVAANGLDNDSHFNTMYNLAVIQFGADKFAEALATMDRFLAETKSEKPEHQAFRAGVLASLDRHEEAASLYKTLVAKNPNDKRLLMNAVATLQAADKFDQANQLLEDAYQRGMLSEERELRSLYASYINSERYKDAERVMEDGLAKGILKPGAELAKGYAILAQHAYFNEAEMEAIRLYEKAAPMATDGEYYLQLAKVLFNSGKKADAKAAAEKALERGVKKPDEAKSLLSR